MSPEFIKLEPTWKKALIKEFDRPYMSRLKAFLLSQLQQEKIIFPEVSEYFAALDLTPLDQVKVVVLGQDPYHGLNMAHGLSFSVRPGVRIPPSLRNIYKELVSDVGFIIPKHGNLTSWAKQGVLLLNNVLTVEFNKPASHQNKGWEVFTDRIVQLLSEDKEGLVFVLWGSMAQKKGCLIDKSKHLVLQSVHPSPLAAHRGFFGCQHFSKINGYLKAMGKAPIDWQLPLNVQ